MLAGFIFCYYLFSNILSWIFMKSGLVITPNNVWLWLGSSLITLIYYSTMAFVGASIANNPSPHILLRIFAGAMLCITIFLLLMALYCINELRKTKTNK